MANDRLSGQIDTEKTLSKLDYWCWLGINCFFAACCGVICFMTPYINSLENEMTSTLSETWDGRWQIITSRPIGWIIMVLLPVAISYGFSRMIGVKSGRPLKANCAFQMACLVFIVQIFLGVLGAINFLRGRTPFNVFGF